MSKVLTQPKNQIPEQITSEIKKTSEIVNLRSAICDQKIAFYIADKRHFDYFDNVIRELQKMGAEVILILNDTRSQYGGENLGNHYAQEMAQLVHERGYPYLFSRDAINAGNVYSLIVSTFSYTYKLPMGKRILKKQFASWVSRVLDLPFKKLLPSTLAQKINTYASDSYIVNRWEYPEDLLAKESVFFPKGLDVSDDYPNPKLRVIADHYFSHGRYDRKIMERNVGKEVFEIGYPRYDRLSRSAEHVDSRLSEEFQMDSERPIICWLPTYFQDKRNILQWIPHFESLTESYNVLIRPHPKQIERDDGSLLKDLKEAGFFIDLKDDRDMTSLYLESWLVCCDYGGTIFSAIYTGANLLLLNVSDHDAIASKRNRSADIHLRTQLLNLSPEEAVRKGGLIGVINDPDLREKQSEWVKLAREEYFGDVKLGEGSLRTAKKLISYLS